MIPVGVSPATHYLVRPFHWYAAGEPADLAID